MKHDKNSWEARLDAIELELDKLRARVSHVGA